VFTGPLRSNRSPIVPSVCFCGNIFSGPLLCSGYIRHIMYHIWLTADCQRISASALCVVPRTSSTFLTSRVVVPWLRRLVAGFPPRRPRLEPREGHVDFVLFSKYFGFPCKFLFHRLLHIHHHLSSGAGTTGQTGADVPSGLSLTPLQLQESKMNYSRCL
jgi:hypothetical protein